MSKGRKRRQARREKRRARRSNRKSARHSRRLDRKEARQSVRKQRIEARVYKKELKANTKQIQAENGINPMSGFAGIAKDVLSVAGNVVSKKLGLAPPVSGIVAPTPPPAQPPAKTESKGFFSGLFDFISNIFS
jgi:hypothetical protein